MYRKCVTDISVHHQKQIEAALLELMLRQPYGDISVTAICQQAGIARRIFYHLFGSKHDTLCALVDHTILGLGSFRSEMTDETLRFLLYWQTQAPLLTALSQNQLQDFLLTRMINNVLKEDFDILHLMQAEDPESRNEIILFHLSGIWGLLLYWHHTGFQKTPEEMAVLINECAQYPSKNTEKTP